MQEGQSEEKKCGNEKLGGVEEKKEPETKNDTYKNYGLFVAVSGAAKGFASVAAALLSRAAALLVLTRGEGGGVSFPSSVSLIKQYASAVMTFGVRVVNVSVRYTFIHRMWRKASAPFSIMLNMLTLKKRKESARNRKNNELMQAVRDGNIREVNRLLSEAEEWRRERGNTRERKTKRKETMKDDVGTAGSLSAVDCPSFSSFSDNEADEDLEDAPIANKNCQIPPATRSTPLHIAVERRHQDIVELLIFRFGVDTNRKDTLGRTPLHLAARRLFQPRVVEALLCSHVYDDDQCRHLSNELRNNNDEDDDEDVIEKDKRKESIVGDLNDEKGKAEKKTEGGGGNAIVVEREKGDLDNNANSRGRDNDDVLGRASPPRTTSFLISGNGNGHDDEKTVHGYDMCEDGEEGVGSEGKKRGEGEDREVVGGAALASSFAVLLANANVDSAPPPPPAEAPSSSFSSSISLSPSAQELMRELDDLMGNPTTTAVSNNYNKRVQQKLPDMSSPSLSGNDAFVAAIPADTSIEGPMGNTPLHSAVEAGLPDFVHLLLEADGKRWAMIQRKIMMMTTMNDKTKNRTSFSSSSSYCCSPLSSVIMMSASEDTASSSSTSYRSCASVVLNTSQKEGHLSANSNISSLLSVSSELLDEAEAQGHISKSDKHFYLNPPITARNGYGSTPLMLALVYNRTSVAKVLLSHGADINEGLAAFPPPLMELEEEKLREKEENQREKEEEEEEESNKVLVDDKDATLRRTAPSDQEKEGPTSPRSDLLVLVSEADNANGGDDDNDDFVMLPSSSSASFVNSPLALKKCKPSNKENEDKSFLLNTSEEEKEDNEKEAMRTNRRLQIHERMKGEQKTKSIAQRDLSSGGDGLNQGHRQGLHEVKGKEEEGKGEEARNEELKKERPQNENCCLCSPPKSGYDREEVVNTILWHCKAPTLLHMNAGIPHFDNADLTHMLIDNGCDPTVRLVKLKKATNIFKNTKLWSFWGGRGGGGGVDRERERAEATAALSSAIIRGGEKVVADDLVVGLDSNGNGGCENDGENTTATAAATCAAMPQTTAFFKAAEEETRSSGGEVVVVAALPNTPPSYTIARIGIAPIDRALEKGNLKIARVLAAEMPDGAPPAALLGDNDDNRGAALERV